MTENQEIFEDIICKILLLKKSQIKNELSRKDIEEWDSMTHLVLISDLEQAFNIIFSDDDVVEMKTIGDIKNKLGKYMIKLA